VCRADIFRVCATAALLAFGADGSAASLGSPEQTLQHYIDSIRRGDVESVRECMYFGKFEMNGPMHVKTFRVKRRLRYGPKLVLEWNKKGFSRPAEVGDVELQVEQTVEGYVGMWSYWFRQKEGGWKIYALAAWGVD
jgi:hypothetical protein